jgi:hypothetical protein
MRASVRRMAASRAGVSSSPSSSSLSSDSESESPEVRSSVSASEPYFSLTAHDQKETKSARCGAYKKTGMGGPRTLREFLALFAVLKRFCIVVVDCELV